MLLSLIAFILLLIATIVFAIRYPSIQTRVAQYFTSQLSKRLDTEVSIGSVDIDFFRTIELRNFLVRDKQRDTLLSAGLLRVDIKLLDLLNNTYDIDRIRLTNATVNLVRAAGSDDFNYEFIVNALSSDKPKDTAAIDLQLSLKYINLENVRFRYADFPSSLDVNVMIPLLTGDLKKFDAAQPLMVFNKLLLDRPDVAVALLPDDPKKIIDTTIVVEPDTGVVHINTKSFAAFADAFEMRGARFRYDVIEVEKDSTMFDYRHIDIRDIVILTGNASFAADTIAADLKHMTLREGCGFQIDTLKGQVRVGVNETSVDNMVLTMPRSRLTNAFAFSYPSFASFYNFIEDVRMRAEFDSAVVDLRDIVCFAPELNDFGAPITVTGKLRGPVSNLRATQATITSGHNTLLKGNITLEGLPNINETFIDFSAEQARTEYADLLSIYPSLSLPKELRQLGTVTFTGNFTGFVNDFVAFGSFNSALGNLKSDLNMKLRGGDRAIYNGNVSSSGFNLGKLLENDMLGNIAFNARLSGSGLSLNNVNASVISIVHTFDLNGYAYKNIDVNGAFDKKLFTGKLTANDPNAVFDFQGTVDFNEALPRYNFYAAIEEARLKPLGFTTDDLVFSTNVSLKMSGDNFDNLQGTAWANDITFQRDKESFALDSLTLNIANVGNEKRIAVNSDVATLTLNGLIDLPTLPASLVATAKSFFPSLPIKTNFALPYPQRFDYSFSFYNAQPVFAFFYPDVKQLDNAIISGNYNSAERSLLLDGSATKVQWQNYTADSLQINAHTLNGRLLFSTKSKDLYIGNTHVVEPNIAAGVQNDAVNFNIKADGESDSNRVVLDGVLRGNADSLDLRLNTSDVVLQGQRWQVQDSNLVVYAKDKLRVENLVFSTEGQSVSVHTNNLIGNDEVIVGFSNLELGTFYRYFKIQDYDASGVINGSAKLINPFTALRFESNFTVNNFVFNNDTIRKITALADYDRAADRVNIDVKAKDSKYDFEAVGAYLPLAEKDQLDLKVEVLKFRLPVLEKYLGEYISSVQGLSYGSLLLRGTPQAPVLTGSLAVKDCNVRINYLQTEYRFNDETVTFNENFVDLEEMTVHDKFGNVATLGGEIFHEHLSKFNLNLYVNTDRFLFLNTSLKDNSLYYGRAFAGGLVTFKGPVDNLEIYANVQSKSGTDLSIPIQDEYDVSEHRNVRFIGATQPTKSFASVEENYLLSLNLDLDITPDAAIKIIFDQKAGDIINGRGKGNLRMEINTDGEFNMYGEYTISQGDYLFTLQNFINKRFVIGQGGTIAWNGDPYEAQVNIEAIYSVRGVSVKDLVDQDVFNGMLPSEQQELSRKIPVDVGMKLTGSLLQPAIAFDLRTSESTSIISSYAYREIDRIKQDENELNKQVFGLLVLNRFIPTSVESGDNLFASGVNASVSEFLFNQLSYWASQNKYNVGVNLDYNTYSFAGSTEESEAKRRELIVGLEKSFFNDRLQVEAGGNFGVGGTSEQSSRVAADIVLRYKLTKDGRYMINAYNKSQYDEILDANRNKRGVSISYQKEFNRLKELFGANDKKPTIDREGQGMR